MLVAIAAASCHEAPLPAQPPPEPPRVADMDHDGISDDRDACPQMPGRASSDPQENGCPKNRHFKVEPADTDPLHIRFKRASSVVEDNDGLIEAIITTLQNAIFACLTIVGNAGSDEESVPHLREERARAVLALLVAGKIAPDRLVAVGGPPSPAGEAPENHRVVTFRVSDVRDCPKDHLSSSTTSSMTMRCCWPAL